MCRVAFTVASALICGATVGQVRPTPYTVIENGMIVDVAFGVQGLQASAKKGKLPKIEMTITASQNTQSLRYASDFINGLAPEPRKWSIHRVAPSGGGIGGGQVSFSVHGVDEIRFRTFDANASEAAFFDITYFVDNIIFDGFITTTRDEKESAQRQKPFLASNFTIKIKDLPVKRVSQVRGFSIESVGDLDGDGRADFAVRDPIVLTLPIEEAGLFVEWANSQNSGVDDVRSFEVEYLDADMFRVFSVLFNVEIESLGYADAFLGPEPSPGRDVRVTLRAKGKVTNTNPPENKGV